VIVGGERSDKNVTAIFVDHSQASQNPITLGKFDFHDVMKRQIGIVVFLIENLS